MTDPESRLTTEGCMIEKFTVHSSSMEREIKAAVVLPPEYQTHPEKRYPVLYAFHGMDAPYDCFSEMIPLREALKTKPMIVACMDADRGSWYLDARWPQKWSREPKDASLAQSLFTTFFLEEYIPQLDQRYRIDPRRRMLSGFSMGGFGALHYLLTRPELFISASSLSGAMGILTPPSEPRIKWLDTLIGPYAGNESRYRLIDLHTRLKEKMAQEGSLRPLFLHCGTEDFLLEDNRQMRDFLQTLGVACEYLESPGGHDWPFWRDASPGVIDFHWRTLSEN